MAGTSRARYRRYLLQQRLPDTSLRERVFSAATAAAPFSADSLCQLLKLGGITRPSVFRTLHEMVGAQVLVRPADQGGVYELA